MTPERLERLKNVLNNRQPDLTVLTDFVHKGRNLSAILRNCDALGVGVVHAVLKESDFDAFRGTAAGSHKWVETISHPSVSDAIRSVQSEGMKVYAANLSKAAVDYRQVDYSKPCAVLFGAEKFGVSEEALALVDGEIYIPMLGMTESFNVSVACAIVLTEACNQRERAGLYGRCRLGPAEYNRLLVEWGQPSIARYCRERGVAYPWLDENGDVPPEERARLR